MNSPYREPPKTPKPAPLRRWWQKSVWEWISFGQALCMIPPLVKYTQGHRYGWAVLYLAFLGTWVYLFFLHRGLVLEELRRKRDLETVVHDLTEVYAKHLKAMTSTTPR